MFLQGKYLSTKKTDESVKKFRIFSDFFVESVLNNGLVQQAYEQFVFEVLRKVVSVTENLV